MKRNLLISFAVILALAVLVVVSANTYSGGVSGTAAGNALLKSTGDRQVGGTAASDDGTTFTINTTPTSGTAKVSVTEANGNTAISGTLGVTGDVAVNTNKFTVTASSGNTAIAGTLAVTGAMNGPFGASRVTAATQAITAAMSGRLFVNAPAADAATVYTLPAASTAGLRYCFSADDVGGSNKEIDVEPPGTTDLIVGTTTPAGGTGIATTAGAGHGIKNTHATAVRGNAVCLQSDGTNTWYMTSLSGVWAAY